MMLRISDLGGGALVGSSVAAQGDRQALSPLPMRRLAAVSWPARQSSRALLLRRALLAWLIDSLVHHAYSASGERDSVRSSGAGVRGCGGAGVRGCGGAGVPGCRGGALRAGTG